ncbi:unnamed protein product [Polarella glacialis]|uniref:DNA (cytosine-5-)-methyltransferase n=2 Tax=Polarella glacialis TaxID=89957 RepID=A0A813ESJ2_POLGL|nr:unnamed protein product [Polarella glacialis]
MSSLSLPPDLICWLNSWGPRLQLNVRQAIATAWKGSIGAERHDLAMPVGFPHPLLVGTDCSGLEAPIFALRAMGLPHRHLFSSDIASAPKAMILANAKPEKAFYDDILVRCHEDTPWVQLYITGFSCKPFSSLHHGTKLLREKEAQVFFATVRYLKTKRPLLFIFENVLGMRRCLKKVMRILREAGYVVVVQVMDPAQLAEPVRRPRLYLFGVRADVAVATTTAVEKFVQETWKALMASAGPVEKFIKAEAKAFPGQKAEPKWTERHRCFSSKLHGKPPGSTMPSADDMLLANPRQRDAWEKLVRLGGGKHIVADLSQNIDRSGFRADGSLPTITPGSVLASSLLRRTIVPIEKVMLHAFPVHRMVFPSEIRGRELESLGGNTMHVQVVAVAICIGLALVDWDLAAKCTANVSTQCQSLLPGSASKQALRTTAQLASGSKALKRKLPSSSRCQQIRAAPPTVQKKQTMSSGNLVQPRAKAVPARRRDFVPARSKPRTPTLSRPSNPSGRWGPPAPPRSSTTCNALRAASTAAAATGRFDSAPPSNSQHGKQSTAIQRCGLHGLIAAGRKQPGPVRRIASKLSRWG